MNGRQTCNLLKSIRKQIAQENDIEYLSAECTYKGPCKGTCPKCESEIRWLNLEIERKIAEGKTIAIPNFTVEEPSTLKSIRELSLSKSITTILENNGITNIEELIAYSEEELLELKGIKLSNIGTIKNKLLKLGYQLKEEDSFNESDQIKGKLLPPSEDFDLDEEEQEPLLGVVEF